MWYYLLHIAVLAILVPIVLYILSIQHKHPNAKGLPLPPGPPGKPFVGNLFDIPPFHSWFQFKRWGDQYGPLFALNIAGRNHIIISKESVANELLSERGTIYSSREQLPMAAKLLSRDLRSLLLPYGNFWREVRKLIHHLINVKTSTRYEPIQEEESLRALRDLIQCPAKYETWFERFSSGLILRLAYSKTVYTGNESSVRRMLGVVHTVERLISPGAYLVDTFPILMRLPNWLAPFKGEAARLHNEEKDLFVTLLDEVKEKMDRGDLTEESFTSQWLAKKGSYKLSKVEAAYVIGVLCEAGAGTTSAAMCSVMLCSTLYPEEYKKLQNEVDTVIGGSRLPVLSDMQRLPRVRAFVKEVLRFRPVTAGGVPHMSTQDDYYELPSGQKVFLPAGSNIHPVQWSIHRDPDLYPEPDVFMPDRWLIPSFPTYREPLAIYPNLHNFSSFGFGRRICPGQNIAEKSLYVMVARIAWACNVSKKSGSDGNAIVPPAYDYTQGANVQPKPFDFALEARDGRGKLVEQEWQDIWGDAYKSLRIPTE